MKNPRIKYLVKELYEELAAFKNEFYDNELHKRRLTERQSEVRAALLELGYDPDVNASTPST